MTNAARLFNKILVAVEMEHRSAAVLYNAVAFAQPDGLVTVLSVARLARGQQSAAVLPERQQVLKDFFARHIPVAAPYLPAVHIEVAFGEPAAEILAAARRLEADLLVMGTRGYGRLKEAIVGSVAHRVLSQTDVPVMVIPPFETEIVSLEATSPVFHLGRIVVPVDPERVSAKQLRVAADLRPTSDRGLLLAYVQHPNGRVVDAAELDAVARAHGLPEDTTVITLPAATVAEGIAELAERIDAGLIVMGLEREDKRMKPGAISYEVTRHTTAVVLTVPPVKTSSTSA